MADRTHTDLNAKARAIVDDAIAELLLMGMASRSSAAALMEIQALIRIDDADALETTVAFAESLRPNDDDGDSDPDD